MRAKNIFTQSVAAFLAVVLLLALIPITALGEEKAAQNYTSTTTATIAPISDTNKEIVIESYLTGQDDVEKTVKPCDIVFVIDQSKWMNTEADEGAQREAIIDELKLMLSALESPTEGEHRVAIAGYGRLNMSASTDPYNASIYPGTRASGNNISLNTGYYTTNGFVSQNGWSDISQSAMTGSGLPQMAASYRNAMTYDNAFMTLDEAENVLNVDTMLAWYAGASRLDAGLTIAEQLVSLASEHDTDDDRNLIVCILASSLPIQNTFNSNTTVIRTEAVLAASEVLKEQGATIFAFGSYHASGKVISGEVQDTEETFTDIMQQVCSEEDYFYSLSNFSNSTDALNEMITQITITAAESAEEKYTVEAQEFTVIGEEEERTVTWQDVVNYYGDNAAAIIQKSKAKVELYKFTGYDSDGGPTFNTTPYSSSEVALSKLVKDDGLAYTTKLVPIPSLIKVEQSAETPVIYGNKVVITISPPVIVTYQWASDEADYAPSNVILPAQEIMAMHTTHTAADVKYTDKVYDDHYVFEGWYTTPECTEEYTGTEAVDADFTLYGKWEKYVCIEYYWNIWEENYTYPDSDEKLKYGETPDPYTPEGLPGYTFGGWYLDKDYTTPYEPEPLTEDVQVYAKWICNEDTEYQVRYYQQNIADDGYTEVTEDAEFLTGTTDSDISSITKTYPGFTWDHTTYEDSTHAAQAEAMTISGDGSLIVRVYFNRNTYRVIYDGNGADGGTVPMDNTAYRYNETVTVAQASDMTRECYVFSHWNTAPDDSGISYDPDDTFAITEDTTLYAQWTRLTWGLRLIKQSDRSERLPNVRFALYTDNPELAPSEDTAIPNSDNAQRQLAVDGTTWYLLEVCLTDQNGLIEWSDLTEKQYYLLELEAPEGYVLGATPGQVVTAQFGSTQEITVINAQAITLPSAGGVGTDAFFFGGITLMAGSAIALMGIGLAKRRQRGRGMIR